MREFFTVALAFASALLLYLGSPRQQWLATPWWPRYSRPIGALLALCAVLAVGDATPLFTTVSVVLTTQMAALVAFPFIGALIGQARQPGTPR